MGLCRACYQAKRRATGVENVLCSHCKRAKVYARKLCYACRGFLCGLCNSMLGLARDNPEVLAEGIKYLNRAKRRPGVG